MEIGRPSPALRRKSFRQHAHDRIKLFTFQIAIWVSASDRSEQIVFRPLFGCDCRHDLLRQNVERLFGYLQTIELTTTNRIDNRRTLNQLITREWKDPALWKTR